MEPVRRRFGATYHDGYDYVLSKKTATTRYMKCTQFRHYCRATAKMPLEGNVDQITVSEQPHNHPRSDVGRDIDRFRRALKHAALVEKGTCRAIYDRVAMQHPNAAENYPFTKSQMSLWRLKARRNQPQDFEDQIQSHQIYNTIIKKFVPARRKFGAIYHDGYEYVVSKSTPVMRYLKCCQFRASCRANARWPVGADVDQIMVSKKPHNHPKSDLGRDIDQFRQALKQACLVEGGTSRAIYERVARHHTNAAGFYPFKRVHSQMAHWRAKSR